MSIPERRKGVFFGGGPSTRGLRRYDYSSGRTKKEGEGRDCELKAAQRLLARQPDLSGKLITADALHAQHETLRTVVERGCEMIVQVKDNQKKAHRRAQDLSEKLAPLLPACAKHTGG